mgnify:FL=1
MAITFQNRLWGPVGETVTNSSLALSGDPTTINYSPSFPAKYSDDYQIFNNSVINIPTGHHRGDTPRITVPLPGSTWCVRWYIWFPVIPTGNGERRWIARIGGHGIVAHQTAAGNFYTNFSLYDISASEITSTGASGTARPTGQWLRVEVRYPGGGTPEVRIWQLHQNANPRIIPFSGVNLSGPFEITGYRYRRRTLLRWGDTGSAVQALQQDLIALGYDLGAAGADGIFGDATYYAVLAFQQDYGITPQDGEAGNETLAAIDIARGRTYPSLYVSHVAVSDGSWIGPADPPPRPVPPPPGPHWSIGMDMFSDYAQ